MYFIVTKCFKLSWIAFKTDANDKVKLCCGYTLHWLHKSHAFSTVVLINHNPNWTLHILNCDYCGPTHGDIDAKTIYCAALVQITTITLVEQSNYISLIVKFISNLKKTNKHHLTFKTSSNICSALSNNYHYIYCYCCKPAFLIVGYFRVILDQIRNSKFESQTELVYKKIIFTFFFRNLENTAKSSYRQLFRYLVLWNLIVKWF